MIIDSIQSLVSAWSIDFYAGWSFMDIAALGTFLIFLLALIDYFYRSRSQ